MRYKKVAALCLVFAMLFMVAPGMGAFASGGTDIIGVTPYYSNTSTVIASLSFSGTTANCFGSITGLSGTTNITATLTLYRVGASGSLTYLNSWSNSVNGASLTVSGSQAVTSGSTYRLTISGQVTRNGTTESVSNYVERAL